MYYPEINQLKSAEAVAIAWSKIFEQTCLDTKLESFNSKPTGFLNTFLALTTQHAATAFYEQQMYINEINPSTSILKKSLMSGLSSDEIKNIYATPATARFALCMKKEDIISEIDKLGSSFLETDRYLVLNRDTVFNIDSYPSFTLQRNVKIMYKTVKYIDTSGVSREVKNVYALYDNSDVIGSKVNPMSSYSITTREIAYQGDVYVLMYLDCKQETRTYTDTIVINQESVDMKVKYTNELCGFELYVEETVGKLTPITVYPEGSTLTGQYQCFYSLNTKQGIPSINISFDKTPSGYRPKASQKLTCVTWTTYGSMGNIEFPNLNVDSLNSLTCNLKQDVTDKRQSAINNVELLIMTKDKRSSGGKDEMTFAELKKYVIGKKRSNDTITSEKQIMDLCQQHGMDVKKIRHDVIAQYYRTFKVFNDIRNNIVASATTPFRFVYDTSKRDDPDFPFSKLSHSLITPKNIFTDQGDFYFYDVNNEMGLREYMESKDSTTFKHQTFFPFFLHVNVGEYVQLYTIDPNINETNIPLNCLMVNDNAQDSITISNFTVYRNFCGEKDSFGLGDDVRYMNLYSGSYKIYFVCTFGNAYIGTIDAGKMSDVKFKLRIISESNGQSVVSESTYVEPVADGDKYKFVVSFDVFIDDNSIEYEQNRFRLMYNKYVDENGDVRDDKLAWCAYPVPSNTAPQTPYMDFGLKFEVAAFFKCQKSEYGSSLAVDDPTGELRNVYDKQWLNSEEMGEISDERYYCVTAYSVDKVQIMKDLTDYVFMNTKINTVLDYPETGEPTTKYDCTIYNILAVDRIYTTETNYQNLLDSFYEYVENVENVRRYLIDGYKLFVGVKKTEGVSSKFKVRRSTDGYEENLNSLSISLAFDIKMENSIEYDSDYVKESLITNLTDYLNGFNEEYLSFDTLYERMKSIVPNIAYINIRKFNGYDVGDYQTLINDVNNVEESLSVKMVPGTGSDLGDIDSIEFVPDISINFIN